MSALTPLFVLVPIIVGILQLVKTLTDYWTRKRLIDNGITDSLGEFTNDPGSKPSISREYANLKWGLIAFFGGLGFILIGVITEISHLELSSRSPLTAGIFFLSIAAGFLVYYAVISRKIKE